MAAALKAPSSAVAAADGLVPGLNEQPTVGFDAASERLAESNSVVQLTVVLSPFPPNVAVFPDPITSSFQQETFKTRTHSTDRVKRSRLFVTGNTRNRVEARGQRKNQTLRLRADLESRLEATDLRLHDQLIFTNELLRIKPEAHCEVVQRDLAPLHLAYLLGGRNNASDLAELARDCTVLWKRLQH